MSQSKHALKGDIITIRRGVAICQTQVSLFWMARVLDPNTKKYAVRSTKETARLKAGEVAEELAVDLADAKKAIPKELGFNNQTSIQRTLRLSGGIRRNLGG